MHTRKSGFPVAIGLAAFSLFLTGCGSKAPEQAAQPVPDSSSAAPAPEAVPPATPGQIAQPSQPGKTEVRQGGAKPASTARSTAAPAGSQFAEVAGQLKVRTTTALSTKVNQAGQTFEASLEESLVYGGKQVLSKGALVTGRVTEVDPGGRVSGRATISVELTGVRSGAQIVPIATDTFTKEAAATKKKDAAKVGIGAGIGAAIGAIAGGAKGAAIGAAAGGGAGTATVLATRGDAAEIPSETVLTFKLAKPARIPIQ